MADRDTPSATTVAAFTRRWHEDPAGAPLLDLIGLDDATFSALLRTLMASLPVAGDAASQVVALVSLRRVLDLRGPAPDQPALRSLVLRYADWRARDRDVDAAVRDLEERRPLDDERESGGGLLLGEEETAAAPPPPAEVAAPAPPVLPPMSAPPAPPAPAPPAVAAPPPAAGAVPDADGDTGGGDGGDGGGGDGGPDPGADTGADPGAAAGAEPPPEDRSWTADVDGLAPGQPLTVGADHTLLVGVGLTAQPALAAAPFDPATFAGVGGDSVALTVQVASDDFDVRSDPVQPLVVPRTGATATPARFVVGARHDGACALTAVVHRDGNFVTLLHLVLPAGQPGEATLTAAGRPPDAVTALEPRDVMLVLEPDASGGYRCIVSANGTQTPTVALPITPDELDREIDHVQQQLLAVVQQTDAAGRLVFQTGVDIDAASEQQALRTLADAGGRLFRKLFFHPAAGADAKELGTYLRDEASDPGALLTMQVTAAKIPIPWGLLYVGDIADDAVLGWDRFLGLRHLVEQVPAGPLLRGRTLEVPSTPQLSLGLDINLQIGSPALNALVEQHAAAWQQLAAQRRGLQLVSRHTRTDVLQALKDPTTADQVLYFYCHARAQGHDGDLGAAALTLEPGQPLTLDDLDANAGSDVLLAGQPLVFLNACESADLSPLFYSGFVPYFMSRGARGVMGTLCNTPAIFAIAFAQSFFARFLDGAPLGEAVLATRQELLRQHHNPLGLLYAVHCDIDTRIDPALRVGA